MAVGRAMAAVMAVVAAPMATVAVAVNEAASLSRGRLFLR